MAYLTLTQAADKLKVSPQTLRKYLKSGLLQGVQFVPGGRWRVSAESIESLTKNALKGAL